MKRIVMCLMMVIAVNSAMADTATVEGIEWNYTVTETGIRLDGIKTSSLSGSELTTPTTIAGKTVTTIGSSCFDGRDTLTAVTISEGVETIESSWGYYYNYSHPFDGSSRLKTISLPSTLKSITGILGLEIHPSSISFPNGNSHFAISGGFLYAKADMTLHCLLDVEAVVVPSGATDIPGGIGESANIESLVVSEGVTSIGGYAFKCCSSLTSLSLPETLETIGSCAFEGSSRCCSHLVIPSSVVSIGTYAFSGSGTVEFMGGSVALEEHSFSGSFNLKTAVGSRQCIHNFTRSHGGTEFC